MKAIRFADPPDAVHERVLAAERLRNARRIVVLRTAFVVMFYVRAVGWAWGLEPPPWSTQQTLMTVYLVGALAIWAASWSSDRRASASSLAVPFFDLPMIFLLVWPPFVDASVERAADSLAAVGAAFSVVILLTVLTLRFWQVLLAGALALAFEGLVAVELGETATATTFAFVLTLTFVVLGLYMLWRLRALVRSTAAEQRLRERLHRHFSPEVAALLERWPRGGATETRSITVLFSDLKSFTPLSATMSSSETVRLLNEVHSRMVRCVFDHGGTLDKFLGDGLLAYFNAPLDQPDHASRATRCAVAMQEALEELNSERTGGGAPAARDGHRGPYRPGDHGDPRPRGRHEYTAIGETVNVAAHVEKATRKTGDRILITESTRRELDPAIRLEGLPPTPVHGVERPMRLFRPLAIEARPDGAAADRVGVPT